VREAEREERAGVRARSIVLAHKHHGRPATLIQAPRAADLDVIQELDVQGSQRKVAAKPAVDARPEAKVLKQLARLEMGTDKRLFRIDRDAPLESDALRVSAGRYHEEDSGGCQTHAKSSLKEDKYTHAWQPEQQRCQSVLNHIGRHDSLVEDEHVRVGRIDCHVKPMVVEFAEG